MLLCHYSLISSFVFLILWPDLESLRSKATKLFRRELRSWENYVACSFHIFCPKILFLDEIFKSKFKWQHSPEGHIWKGRGAVLLLKTAHMEIKLLLPHQLKKKKKDVAVINDLATLMVNLEGTQNGKKECLPSSHQSVVTHSGAVRGNSGWENTGYWSQTAKMNIKGMISVSPESCISPYIEKHKFLNLRYLVFFC